ncbi:MAG: hypothetical protein NC483_00430 [Ruminococcus sp.]|nr:hypothetical protein [Ruminococcus sp.]
MRIDYTFLINNYNENERLVIESSIEQTVKGETEKAALIEFDSDYGKLTRWFPKSVISGMTFTKGTGKMIRLKNGEIREVSNIMGAMVRATDGKSYLKSTVEFI